MNARYWARHICLSLSLVWMGTTTASAAAWTIDAAKSRLAFSGVQTGSKFEGAFGRWTAAIDLDPASLDTSRVEITIDLASASSGDVQRDTALPGADWFDVAHHPRAIFEAATVRHVEANRYEAAGKLTIRGITNPLTLPFTLDIQGQSAHAQGHVELVRTAFGVGQGPWQSGQWVALEVGVDFDISASKAN